MKTRFKALAAAALAGVLAFAPAAPAAAMVCPVPPFDCPNPQSLDDAFCVYDFVNYQSLIDWWDPQEPRNTCVRIEQGPQYKADSIYNNTAYVWRLFRTGTCGGSHMAIQPYSSIPRLPDGWRNEVVGFSRTSTTSGPC